MRKKIFTLLTIALCTVVGANAAVTWPDANYLLLDGKDKNKIATGNSASYTDQVGGTGVTWAANTDKYSYGNTTCTFYGNAFTKGLKHEGATYTEITTTATATLTIVQSLANNATGTLQFEKTDAPTQAKAEIETWDNYLATSYEGTQTVGGKTYKDVKVMKIFNLPAGTYKVYRGTETVQTYVVYMGVTYETTPTYTISTAMSNEGSSTVSGSGSYLRGFPATLTASPGAGKAFDHWELAGSNVSTDNPYTITVSADATYTAVFADAATKSITVDSNNDTYGSADATATVVAEGSTTTLTATPASEAYYFVNWTKDTDGSWSNTTNPLDIAYDDVSDGATYTANFAAYKKITYSVGTNEKGTQTSYQSGTMIKYADKTGNITMPNNYAFVYSDDFAESVGYTLKYWSNGGPNYATGSGYTLADDAAGLVPVFVANSVSLATDLTDSKTVTWNFASNESAPDVHVEGNTGYYVVQTTINGTTIDVPMYITGSKFNMTATRAQVNATTNFKVPAVKGMVVTYTADNGSPAAADFGYDDESNVEFSVDEKVVTITYNGTNSSLTISDKNGNLWPKSLAVKYPASTIAVSTKTGRNYATCVPAKRLDFGSADGITAYIATELNGAGTAVVLQEVSVVDAGTPVIVKTDAQCATVNVPVTTAAADDPSDNLLVAGDGTTAATSEYYFIKEDQFHQANAGTLQSGKAYLYITAGTPAPTLSFIFGDDATGISSVSVNSIDASKAVFNLQGQRIQQPRKGLYIVNGKKIVVK